MDTVKVKVFRVRAALALPRTDVMLIAFALMVIQKMTNNPNFPNAAQVVAALDAAVKNYQQALRNMGTNKNAGDDRTKAKQGVKDQLKHVQDHVNGVAEGLDPDAAAAAITSAGLRAKKRSSRAKAQLEVKYGGLPGTIWLIAKAAGRKAMYFFETSADQKNWSACPFVMTSKITLSGLTVGTTYYFRFRAQTPKGLTDYSMVVSFPVR